MVQHADIDHTGLPGIGSGNVATDTIWDAAGDLAVGSGANTAARLAIGGTNGMALRRVSGAVAWDLPPAHEFAYVEFTSNVNVTATAEASGDTIVSAGSVTFDGSTIVIVEFFSPISRPATTAVDDSLSWFLFDGSSSIGRMGTLNAPAAQSILQPINGYRRLTPSAAAHTYSIRGIVSNGTGVVGAGAGGSGNVMPGYIRIIKV